MPTLSASDYTNFVKLQAAQPAYASGAIPRTIQRTAQPVPTVSILNAQLLASQASFVVNPKKSTLTSITRVAPRNPVLVRSNKLAKSTVSFASPQSITSYNSSATPPAGGLPAKNKVGTYYRDAHTALPLPSATGAYSKIQPNNTLLPNHPNTST